MFTVDYPQTPLSVFLRNGAAGTSGTVTEPFAIQNKFPHAMVQVHYARGCTLAEAFYQAVYAPYQLLVVGDPLCRPWANIPQVAVDGAKAGETLKGNVALRATATLPRGGSVDRFELFIDGLRVASESAGEPLELDTRLYADGDHELRVVGIENSAIESQGRAILPVRFDNYGNSIRFEISAATDKPLRLGQKIQLSAEARGARRGLLSQPGNDREVRRRKRGSHGGFQTAGRRAGNFTSHGLEPVERRRDGNFGAGADEDRSQRERQGEVMGEMTKSEWRMTKEARRRQIGNRLTE